MVQCPAAHRVIGSIDIKDDLADDLALEEIIEKKCLKIEYKILAIKRRT